MSTTTARRRTIDTDPAVIYRSIVRAMSASEFDRADIIDRIGDRVSPATAEELASLVMFDALTGAYSRDCGLREMTVSNEFAAEAGFDTVLLFCDLNGFKAVNDTYGHRVGDIVLATFANYILKACGDSIVTVRLSGDEFAVLVESSVADGVAAIIREFADRPIVVDESGSYVNVGVAIGSAPVTGTIAEALSVADMRMYADKGESAR